MEVRIDSQEWIASDDVWRVSVSIMRSGEVLRTETVDMPDGLTEAEIQEHLTNATRGAVAEIEEADEKTPDVGEGTTFTV